MKEKNIISAISRFLSWISGAAIFFMMILMVADAIGRKIVGSVPGGYYATIAILIIVLFFSQGYAQMRKAHITIDLVTSKLSKKTQRILSIITNLMAVFFFGVVTWAGFLKAVECTRTKEEWMGAIFFPAWPWRWTIPIGLGVFTLQLVVTVIDEIRKPAGRE